MALLGSELVPLHGTQRGYCRYMMSKGRVVGRAPWWWIELLRRIFGQKGLRNESWRRKSSSGSRRACHFVPGMEFHETACEEHMDSTEFDWPV